MNQSSDHPVDLISTFREGICLFNAGAYWHAHEQWEICWRAAQGSDAIFYQTLIQIAAALVKQQQGNLHGLRRNWAKAAQRLTALPPIYRGIDLEALAQAMHAVLADPIGAPPPQINQQHG